MKIKINKSLLKMKAKSVRKRRKIFENEIKEIIYKSFQSNHNNRDLVQQNASLLQEIEILKKQKLDLFQSLFKSRQKPNPNLNSDLIVLLNALKSDHKNMIQLFCTSNEFYNQMIDKISDKLQELVEREDKSMDESNRSTDSDIRSEEGVSKSQQILQKHRESKQLCRQRDEDNPIDSELTVIEEQTEELTSFGNNSINAEEGIVSPMLERNESLNNYDITPNFSTQPFRTPSIYNFKGIHSFQSYNRLNDTSLSPLDLSLNPELSITDFHTMDSTFTEEQNGLTSSTPVTQKAINSSNLIQRPSIRLSSINRPFSPRIARPSLIDIRNVIETQINVKKPPIVSNDDKSETNTSESIDNQSNDTKTLNNGKKRRKNCSTKSFDLDSSDVCNLSVRSSRRNRKPVSYKEPPLHCKLRRPIGPSD